MNVNYKKLLKLATLLISSLLIATVSAATYNMFMSASVGVGATGMSFVASEPDFTDCGGAITDNYQKVTFSSMNGIAGQEAIYRPVDISNTDVGGHNIELVLDTWTGDGEANLYSITISMYDSTENQKGDSIVLLPGGGSVTTSGSVNIAVETWQVEWEVYWKGTAVAETVEVNLLLIIHS